MSLDYEVLVEAHLAVGVAAKCSDTPANEAKTERAYHLIDVNTGKFRSWLKGSARATDRRLFVLFCIKTRRALLSITFPLTLWTG